MDRLSERERALAWAASWDPSFSGIAIIDPDFVFRSVNQQFCEVLGASPAELLGQRFLDLTPHPVKKIEETNANMVKQGIIDSYLMSKVYEFHDGRTIQVVLLVKGVYSEGGEFQFFVSQIMREEQKKLPTQLPLAQKNILEFIKAYSPIFIGAGAFIGSVIWTLIKFLGETK